MPTLSCTMQFFDHLTPPMYIFFFLRTPSSSVQSTNERKIESEGKPNSAFHSRQGLKEIRLLLPGLPETIHGKKTLTFSIIAITKQELDNQLYYARAPSLREAVTRYQPKHKRKQYDQTRPNPQLQKSGVFPCSRRN